MQANDVWRIVARMRLLLLIIAAVLASTGLHAQSPVVGVVVDSAGRPIPAVEVQAGARRTQTDAEGRFQLEADGDPVRLRFRRVGLEPMVMQTPRASASPANPLQVTIRPSSRGSGA